MNSKSFSRTEMLQEPLESINYEILDETQVKHVTHSNQIREQLRKIAAKNNVNMNKDSDPYVIKLFSEVFTGMSKRYSRLKIILALSEESMNVLQLSKKLDYDYKSMQRNLEILEKKFLVDKIGNGYGNKFYLTELLSDNFHTLLKVFEKNEKKLNRRKIYID